MIPLGVVICSFVLLCIGYSEAATPLIRSLLPVLDANQTLRDAAQAVGLYIGTAIRLVRLSAVDYLHLTSIFGHWLFWCMSYRML
jgi:hypothetical protein